MSPELYDLIRAGGENLRRNYCTRLMEAARLIAAERERERFFFLFPGRCSRKERERERGKGASSARRELYFIRFLGRSFRSIKEKSLSRLGSTSPSSLDLVNLFPRINGFNLLQEMHRVSIDLDVIYYYELSFIDGIV